MPETNYYRLKEEASFGKRHLGAVLVTVGKVLLWMDVLLLIFVYVGVRGGSDFWLWWVAIEGVLGFVLLGVGIYIRAHGRGVEPPARGPGRTGENSRSVINGDLPRSL